jgi:uroporphyrinogen decarboxylase
MGIPDQVPCLPFVTGHYIAWFNDMPEGDYWSDPVRKLPAQLAVQERFPDVMLYPGIYPDYSVVIEPSAFGGPVTFPRNASPQLEPFLTTPEQVLALEPADPERDGLMPKALDTIRYMLDHCPKKWIDEHAYLAGSANCLGPTDVAGLSRGYGTFGEDLYKRPAVAHHLMAVATETLIRYLHAQEAVGGKLHHVQVADDSIGFISKRHFVEFSLPYLQRIFAEFPYAIKILHCDAKTNHLLDVIADTGMDVFNFDSGMDIGLVKQKVGARVCLLGNIAPLTILLNGTPEEVDAECRRIIEIGKPGGGFMLTMGSGTARGTPAENIDAMIQACAKYGRYDTTEN